MLDNCMGFPKVRLTQQLCGSRKGIRLYVRLTEQLRGSTKGKTVRKVN